MGDRSSRDKRRGMRDRRRSGGTGAGAHETGAMATGAVETSAGGRHEQRRQEQGDMRR